MLSEAAEDYGQQGDATACGHVLNGSGFGGHTVRTATYDPAAARMTRQPVLCSAVSSLPKTMPHSRQRTRSCPFCCARARAPRPRSPPRMVRYCHLEWPLPRERSLHLIALPRMAVRLAEFGIEKSVDVEGLTAADVSSHVSSLMKG